MTWILEEIAQLTAAQWATCIALCASPTPPVLLSVSLPVEAAAATFRLGVEQARRAAPMPLTRAQRRRLDRDLNRRVPGRLE